MASKVTRCLVGTYLFLSASLWAQMPPLGESHELQKKSWRAQWIAAVDSPAREYGVYHFRRSFALTTKPSRFIVHVSADNRYRLLVNGRPVGEGPARGDLNHWRFESLDIATQLQAGRNVIAALVWNTGPGGPIAQTTFRTGFLLQGDTDVEKTVDSGPEWKVIRDEGYAPIPVTYKDVYGYWAAGPGDRVHGTGYPWGWETVDFDDAAWPKAVNIARAAGRDARDSPSRWMLVSRSIPMMEERPLRLARVRASDQLALPGTWPNQAASVSVPANTKASILLDQDYLVTGYPEIEVSGGARATVTLSYAESLYLPGKPEKGNRDVVEGKEFKGNRDEFVLDGGEHRVFRPLWWRTWRYLRVTVETGSEPVRIEDLRATSSMYPFDKKSSFAASDPVLTKMGDIGWRTARLCAHETYMDCPYYEQLQYVGDTRIQAMVTLFMTGDTRIVRQAIEAINDSRTPEGATYSRAPSELQQYIPGFSLWWIGMLHDYARYADDEVFVRSILPGTRTVLQWFSTMQQADGSLGQLPWWPYVDWTKEWKGGDPPLDANGNSALHDLQLLLALDYAKELERRFGMTALASLYEARAKQLRATIQRKYWDASRGLIADNAGKSTFSQQTQAMAVLSGVVTGQQAKAVMEKAIQGNGLTRASIYFSAYFHDAVRVAGLGGQYLGLLGEWRDQMDRGLTTWAEMFEPSRSDCHAWGASPNYNFFKIVLGIDATEFGFRKVRIAPQLGDLTWAEGTMPHPQGQIQVRIDMNLAKISLPAKVTGELVWKGKSYALTSGEQTLRLP